MNEKKKKPSAAQKACKDVLAFLHGQVFGPKQPPAAEPKVKTGVEITLTVDSCCIEAIAFALQAATSAGLLDGAQQGCITGVICQLLEQVPFHVKSQMGEAVGYARRRHAHREHRQMYAAAMAAPSRN